MLLGEHIKRWTVNVDWTWRWESDDEDVIVVSKPPSVKKEQRRLPPWRRLLCCRVRGLFLSLGLMENDQVSSRGFMVMVVIDSPRYTVVAGWRIGEFSCFGFFFLSLSRFYFCSVILNSNIEED
jgi:hypothetical protein